MHLGTLQRIAVGTIAAASFGATSASSLAPAGDAAGPLLVGGAAAAQAAGNPLAPQIAKITSSDPADGDLFGWSVALSGDTAAVGAPKDRAAPFRGLVYIFERDLGGLDRWGQADRVNGLAAQTNDDFGWSVALDGDTLVASAPYDDQGAPDSGAVYIYAREPGGWTRVRGRKASDARGHDKFGWDVALAGDTLFVAAHLKDPCPGPECFDAGAVYLLERNAGGAENWGELRTIVPSEPVAGGNFGTSIDLSGDRLVVGDPGAQAVYVYERDEGGADNWGEVARITPEGIPGLSSFGRSVAIDGNVIVVGDRRARSPGAGRAGGAFLFERSSAGAWVRTVSLYAPDASSEAKFGNDVDLRDDLLVVGAWREGRSCPGCGEGSAYVFWRDQGGPGRWGGLVKISAADAEPMDLFGAAVAIDDDGTIVVGASEGEPAITGGPGSAYVFRVAELRPPALEIVGECPGTATFTVSGATPDGKVLLLGSREGAGSALVSGGACAGTIINMAAPRVLVSLTADAAGEASAEVELPPSVCGSLLQASDLTTCGSSWVTPVP